MEPTQAKPVKKLPGESNYTVWEADGQSLTFGLKTVSWLNRTIISIQEFVRKRFNPSFKIEMNENTWEVVSVSQDKIELVRAASKTKKRSITMTLRRIPE